VRENFSGKNKPDRFVYNRPVGILDAGSIGKMPTAHCPEINLLTNSGMFFVFLDRLGVFVDNARL